MAKFENASIVKKANIYYDGKVTSRTVELEDGSIVSLGIMLEGDYKFNTKDKEIMNIYSGDFELKLSGSDEFITMTTPCSFTVEADSSFEIKIKSVTDYCCSYVK
jgi:purine/pyrimidine-nucleoside phosphorylase